jgi:response regulator of citrate/malate metabolism
MINTLVVDDDYRVAAINAAYVRQVDGFNVIGQAHTAAQTLAAVESTRPDLILLDLYLPDGNGLTVMQRLVEHPHPRPDVLAVTAARDVTSVRMAMQLGAVNYLVKPFRAAALRERLAAYRDLRRRLTSLAEADQHDVDALYGLMHAPPTTLAPPKGHSAPTLALVLDAVRDAGRDLSAAEVATSVGISRPTAQRYLSYLVQHGILRLQLRYGNTGRPEHRYTARHNAAAEPVEINERYEQK